MRGTTYAITPYDSHSHPWMAHTVVKMQKDQITQRQVQVIVLRSIAHEKLGWHKQIKKWCRHRRMLKSGNQFKVKLQSKHRRMQRCAVPFKQRLRQRLSAIDKVAFIGSNDMQGIKQRGVDKTTTHRLGQNVRSTKFIRQAIRNMWTHIQFHAAGDAWAHLHQVARWMCNDRIKEAAMSRLCRDSFLAPRRGLFFAIFSLTSLPGAFVPSVAVGQPQGREERQWYAAYRK